MSSNFLFRPIDITDQPHPPTINLTPEQIKKIFKDQTNVKKESDDLKNAFNEKENSKLLQQLNKDSAILLEMFKKHEVKNMFEKYNLGDFTPMIKNIKTIREDIDLSKNLFMKKKFLSTFPDILSIIQ